NPAYAGRRRRSWEAVYGRLGCPSQVIISRYRWIYRHDIWCADDASDWRDVTDEIVIELVVECGVDRGRVSHQQERVAVGRGTHDRLGANLAAATRPVVDNKLLAEPLRQPLSHQPREEFVYATCGNGHDDAHRLRRIDLRLRNSRHGRERGSARGQIQKISAGKFHFKPPFTVAVGTCVSSHAPRTEPYVRLSRIRLPPRVYDGESGRIRSSAFVTRAWLWVQYVLC